MSRFTSSLFFVAELVAGVFAMLLLGAMAGRLFNLKPKQKLKVIVILYIGLVVILIKA